MSECERVECHRDAMFIASPYGTPEKLCPFHAYAAPNRRPIYPKDRSSCATK